MLYLPQIGVLEFICGVVEGFYGRPWTVEQRKRLFGRMKEFGMNTYLYAPKDDSKHRAYWRDLYLVEEAEALRELIEACSKCNINFIYAISPGLDITYSSQKEQTILRRKSASAESSQPLGLTTVVSLNFCKLLTRRKIGAS